MEIRCGCLLEAWLVYCFWTTGSVCWWCNWVKGHTDHILEADVSLIWSLFFSFGTIFETLFINIRFWLILCVEIKITIELAAVCCALMDILPLSTEKKLHFCCSGISIGVGLTYVTWSSPLNLNFNQAKILDPYILLFILETSVHVWCFPQLLTDVPLT